MSLPFDTCRCRGSLCKERDSCLRFLTIASDRSITETVRLPYSDNLCMVVEQGRIIWHLDYKIAV